MLTNRILLGLLVAGAAACGSGGTSYPTGSTSSSGGNNPPGGPATASVAIVDYSFTPANVTVKVGSSVVWTNGGSVAHTVTADDGSFASGQLASPTGGGIYGGGSAGGSFSRMFSAAGTYTYHCSNHTYMTGTITVTP